MKTIMVVDDEAIHRSCLCYLVKNSAYKAIPAISGEQALLILEKFNIDLILLDINMPGIDGFETARRIKANEKTKNITIFFATGEEATPAILEKSRNAGISEFITKPYAFLELHRLLDKHFGKPELVHPRSYAT